MHASDEMDWWTVERGQITSWACPIGETNEQTSVPKARSNWRDEAPDVLSMASVCLSVVSGDEREGRWEASEPRKCSFGC